MRMIAARTNIVVTLMALAATAGGQWVEDSIYAGGNFISDLAYNSRANVMYGVCELFDHYFAISCDSNEVLYAAPVHNPISVAYDSVDNKAYIVFRGADWDSVLVIDGSTHRRIGRLAVPGAKLMAWDPEGNFLCISCDLEDRVTIVDCTADTVVRHIPVGGGPLGMHLNSRHHKLYVQNYDDNSVSVICLDSLVETARVPVGRYARSGYYSAAVDKYYCDGYEVVSVIDGDSDVLVGTIPLPAETYAMSMTGYDRTDLVVVGVYANDTSCLLYVDGNEDTVLGSLPAGDGPAGLYWSAHTNLVYVAGIYSDSVVVATGDGARVVASIAVGDAPHHIAYSPVNHRLYVSHLNSRYVYVVRDALGAVGEGSAVLETRPGGPRVWPNPFWDETTIDFGTWPRGQGGGDARVFSRDGRLVRALGSTRGHTQYRWDGRDARGRALPPGVYCIVGPESTQVVTVMKLR